MVPLMFLTFLLGGVVIAAGLWFDSNVPSSPRLPRGRGERWFRRRRRRR